MNGLFARADYAIARWGPWVVAGLLALSAIAGGLAGVAYANPPTTQVTDTVDRRTVTSTMHVHATASGETALYAPGETLVDQPVYFRDSTSSVTLRYRTAVAGDGSVSAEQRVRVVYVVTRRGKTFWRASRLLARSDGDGGAATGEATLSMPAVAERLAEIRADLDGAASVRAQLVYNVSYATGDYTGSFTERTTIRSGSGWFAVAPLSADRNHRRTETRTVELPARDEWSYRLPAVLSLLCVVAAGAVGHRHRRGESPDRREYRVHEHRYREWISRGSLGGDLPAGRVQMDSLEGLVDAAIDADRRVVHDEEHDLFAVVAGSVVYYFVPDGDGDGERGPPGGQS